MAGKRLLLVVMFSLLASVGCRHWCERTYPCQQPCAYPVAAQPTACVPCVPCCPPGGVSGYSSAPAAVPAPPPTTWNAPVTRGASPAAACVPCQ